MSMIYSTSTSPGCRSRYSSRRQWQHCDGAKVYLQICFKGWLWWVASIRSARTSNTWNLAFGVSDCLCLCKTDWHVPVDLWTARTMSTLTLSPQTICLCYNFLSFYNCILFRYLKNLENHSERWITRLANRWRAQQSAITIANCRIYWAAITWTQIAASGIPGATFAWGSTI